MQKFYSSFSSTCFFCLLFIIANVFSSLGIYAAPKGGCPINDAGQLITNYDFINKTGTGAICQGQWLELQAMDLLIASDSYEAGFIIADHSDLTLAEYIHYTTDPQLLNEGDFPMGIDLYFFSAVLPYPFINGIINDPCSAVSEPLMMRLSPTISITVDQDCASGLHELTIVVSPEYEVINNISIAGVNYGSGPTIYVDVPNNSTQIVLEYSFGDCGLCDYVMLHPMLELEAIQTGCDGESGSVLLSTTGGSGAMEDGNFYLSIDEHSFHHIYSTTITGLSDGYHNLCVKDGESGCVACADIQVLNTPDAPQVSNGTTCAGEELAVYIVDPNPIVQYNWYADGVLQNSEQSQWIITNPSQDVIYEVSASVLDCESPRTAINVEIIQQPIVVEYTYACTEDYQVSIAITLANAGNYYDVFNQVSFTGDSYVLQTHDYSIQNFLIELTTAQGMDNGCESTFISIEEAYSCLPPIQANEDDLGVFNAGELVTINDSLLLPNDEGVMVSILDVSICDETSPYTTMGSVEQVNGNWIYSPPSNLFVGTDTICYAIIDELGQISNSYITITYINPLSCDYVSVIDLDCLQNDTSTLDLFRVVLFIQGVPNEQYLVQLLSADSTIYEILTADDEGYVNYISDTIYFENVALGYDGTITLLNNPACVRNYYLEEFSCSPVVNVEFIDFSLARVDNQVKLYWATGTEHDAAYFTIEKSYDGLQFEPIGTTLQAMGNSTVTQYYSLLDDTEIKSIQYYRLSETDIEGHIKYYNKILQYKNDLIAVDTQEPYIHNNILYTDYQIGHYDLSIVDAAGRVVIQQVITNHNYDLSILANGIYFINIHSTDNRYKTIKYLKF